MMIAKIRIRNPHPVLDIICTKYKLTLQDLFPHAPLSGVIKKIEYTDASITKELQTCKDVILFRLEPETPPRPISRPVIPFKVPTTK